MAPFVKKTQFSVKMRSLIDGVFLTYTSKRKASKDLLERGALKLNACTILGSFHASSYFFHLEEKEPIKM